MTHNNNDNNYHNGLFGPQHGPQYDPHNAPQYDEHNDQENVTHTVYSRSDHNDVPQDGYQEEVLEEHGQQYDWGQPVQETHHFPQQEQPHHVHHHAQYHHESQQEHVYQQPQQGYAPYQQPRRLNSNGTPSNWPQFFLDESNQKFFGACSILLSIATSGFVGILMACYFLFVLDDSYVKNSTAKTLNWIALIVPIVLAVIVFFGIMFWFLVAGMSSL